jgi:hypothetical protein
MTRLPIIGAIAAGLLIAVVPPAVAAATPTSAPGTPTPPQKVTSPLQKTPNPDGPFDNGAPISIADMEAMQQKMNRLSQLSQQTTAIVTGSPNPSVSQQARQVTGN